jgi:hypothetical protein
LSAAIKKTRPIKHPTTMVVGKKKKKGEKEGEEVLHETFAYKQTCMHLLTHATRNVVEI